MMEVELVVVGAGPAGLSAAIAAKQCGVSVRLIDENRQMGGQYFRQPPTAFALPQSPADDESGALFSRARTLGVDVELDTLVWGIFDQKTLALAHGTEVTRLRTRALVLATGASDRPTPFPGWTLPGVVTAGGAQNLMKGYRILPGRRVLIAGSGPLLFVVAYHLLQGGAELVAVCEASSLRDLWRHVPRILRHPGFVRQAARYWAAVRRAGVPILGRHIIVRALGTTSISTAVVSACDNRWFPVAGTEREFDVDALVVGYGFVPSTDLLRLAGCQYRYEFDLGGWIPILNDRLESTVPGVFVAGEASGIGGAAVALEEGRLAGLAAAQHLGAISEQQFAVLAAPVRARLRRLSGLRAVMDEVFRAQPGLASLIDDDTVVCRCEDVTAGQVRHAVEDGARLVSDVKVATRAGMGRCQGRICQPAVAAIICRETGCSPDRPGMFTARIPVRPLPLETLCHAVGDLATVGPVE